VSPRRPIGEILVELGILSQDEIVVIAAAGGSQRLCSRLLEQGRATEAELVRALAMQLGVPGVDLSHTAFPLSNLTLFPKEIASAELMLPVHVEPQRMLIALANPLDQRLVDEVGFISGLEVFPHVALHGRLHAWVERAYADAAAGKSRFVGEALAPDAPDAVALVAPEERTAAEELPEGQVILEVAEGEEEEEEELGAVRAYAGPKRVLVVDDEPDIRNMVRIALEKNGYAVETASRGSEALEKIRSLPDLLLLDAMLPEVHGFEICKMIKGSKKYNRIPVMMMTAIYRGWRFAQDARESYGADDYLEKPFRLDDLLRRVKELLARAAGERPPHDEKSNQLYERGVAALKAGQIADAVAALEQGAREDPLSYRLHFQLGRALQTSGDTYRAVSEYERAVELKPDLFPALRSLAALYQQKGFKRKAIDALERAIPAAPDEPTRVKLKQSLLAML
jgi:DNA-binding response OmpR family regulator